MSMSMRIIHVSTTRCVLIRRGVPVIGANKTNRICHSGTRLACRDHQSVYGLCRYIAEAYGVLTCALHGCCVAFDFYMYKCDWMMEQRRSNGRTCSTHNPMTRGRHSGSVCSPRKVLSKYLNIGTDPSFSYE